MKKTAFAGVELSCHNPTTTNPKYQLLATYFHHLKSNGYVVIPYDSKIHLASVIDALGKKILVTEICENPTSTRLLASNEGMGFHTDHFAAKWIAWFCNSQSVIGGESLLIDVHQLIQNYSSEHFDLLSKLKVKSHQVFYKDPKSYSLLQLIEQEWAVFFSEWLVQEPTDRRSKNVLKEFMLDIKKVKPIQLKLSEGDVLIINNHRMLHGRNPFPKNSNRWLTRYWIQ
jgi:hypothetical protein